MAGISVSSSPTCCFSSLPLLHHVSTRSARPKKVHYLTLLHKIRVFSPTISLCIKKCYFELLFFFKKNWLRPLRSCFVFVTVGRMETELRDVSKPECIVSICCRLPPPSSSPQTVHPNLLLRSVERKSFSRHTPRVWKLGLSQKGIDAWKNQGNCSERAEKSGNAI